MEAFRKLDHLPVNIDFCDQGTVDHFVVNQASWHKKCHQKFNTSMLKESEELEASSCHSRLKRRCNSVQQNVCLFCDSSSGNLHEFTTLSADKSIKSMASEMNDTDMLVKLADGDLVAIEAKYHLSCLTKYRNQYRGYVQSCITSCSSASEDQKRGKCMAFANTVSYIENCLKNRTFIFKLSEVHKVYNENLCDLGLESSVNKTRLKIELLEHFQNSAIQEQSDGKNTLLVFPEGMQELHQKVEMLSDYKFQALQIARVAKHIREEIFGHENFNFCGSFPKNCQSNSVPYSLKLLTRRDYYHRFCVVCA